MNAAQRAHLKEQVSERQRRRHKLDKKLAAGARRGQGPHAPKGYGRRYAA